MQTEKADETRDQYNRLALQSSFEESPRIVLHESMLSDNIC
jgi:hypothetical protein